MHASYDDIRQRIAEEPTWYDQNGTPRYGKFEHERCPNIYATTVVLLEIACQDCGYIFHVQMSRWMMDMDRCLLPKQWHYGDPPQHRCIGDSMNCDDLAVLEVWQRENMLNWKRHSELEGPME